MKTTTINKKNPLFNPEKAWVTYNQHSNYLDLSKRGRSKAKILFLANYWINISLKKESKKRTLPTNRQFAEFADCGIRWVKRVLKNSGIKKYITSIIRKTFRKNYYLREITGNVSGINESINGLLKKTIHSKKYKDDIKWSDDKNQKNIVDHEVDDTVFDLFD